MAIWMLICLALAYQGALLRSPGWWLLSPPRVGRARRMAGALLLVLAAWLSPLWQVPVGSWYADLSLPRWQALEGASCDDVFARTGLRLEPFWTVAGRAWFAPLSPHKVELFTANGARLDVVRLD